MQIAPADENIGPEYNGHFQELESNLKKDVAESHATHAAYSAHTYDARYGITRWCKLTWYILCRTFLIKFRDPICLATQIASGVLMGLIYGALYFNVYEKSSVSFSILDTQMCIVMTGIT